MNYSIAVFEFKLSSPVAIILNQKNRTPHYLRYGLLIIIG